MDQDCWELGQKKDLSTNAVKRYLELLQREPATIRIGEIQDLRNPIVGWDTTPQVLVPFQVNGSWAFAMVFEDCVHWFHSFNLAIHAPSEKPSGGPWTGPKNDDFNCTGIYMLIGIRRLLAGLPHLSQIEDGMKDQFRCRLFAELLCNRLNPSKGEVQVKAMFYNSISEEETAPTTFENTFWDDATYGMEGFEAGTASAAIAKNGTHYEYPPQLTEEEPILFPQQSAEPAAVNEMRDHYRPQLIGGGGPILARQQSTEQVSDTGVSDTGVSSTGLSSTGLSSTGLSSADTTSDEDSYTNQPIDFDFVDFRKIIVKNLNAAVTFCRSRQVSEASDLELLWTLVKKQKIDSEFHRRYFAALYFEKFSNADDVAPYNQLRLRAIRSRQDKHVQCKVWKDFCNFQKLNGAEKYAILCALPAGNNALTAEYMDEIKSRLSTAGSSLESYLQIIAPMVCSILKCQLPSQRLLIEDFRLRASEPMSTEVFKAYTSLDPHVQIDLNGLSSA